MMHLRISTREEEKQDMSQASNGKMVVGSRSIQPGGVTGIVGVIVLKRDGKRERDGQKALFSTLC